MGIGEEEVLTRALFLPIMADLDEVLALELVLLVLALVVHAPESPVAHAHVNRPHSGEMT